MKIQQCDAHRRNDEARRSKLAFAALAQAKRNRAEWFRRSVQAFKVGNDTLALDLFHRAIAERIDG